METDNDGNVTKIDYDKLKIIVNTDPDNAAERLKQIEALEKQDDQTKIMETLAFMGINKTYLTESGKGTELFDKIATESMIKPMVISKHMEDNDLKVKDYDLIMEYQNNKKTWDEIKDSAFEKETVTSSDIDTKINNLNRE
jgi:hypothetical protein